MYLVPIPQPKKTIPFTPQKYAEMQAKFKALKTEQEEVKKRLKTAREMGDLSENGAYKYAKFELVSIGRQLRDLRKLLSEGYPTEKTNTGGIVEFGKTITLQKEGDTKNLKTYMLVSEHESNPLEGKLALSSPIGKALVNKKIGDQVTVSTPRGEQQFIIIDVQ